MDPLNVLTNLKSVAFPVSEIIRVPQKFVQLVSKISNICGPDPPLTVILKVQLVMVCCKNLCVQFVMCSCLFYIFNHLKTGGLSRLKSNNFVIFQDN